MTPAKHTGLVCPECHQPVADIEHADTNEVRFRCPDCGNRWSAPPAWHGDNDHRTHPKA